MKIVETFLPLPPNSDAIEFISMSLLDGVTLRIYMKIGEITFKRLNQIHSKRYPVCWLDEYHALDGGQMLDDDKASDLESIFQNYLLENKLTVDTLSKQKQIS